MRVSLFLVLFLATKITLACSCAVETPDEMFDRAKHVFVARITQVEDVSTVSRFARIRQDDDLHHTPGVDYGLRMQFEVETTIKGNPSVVRALSTGRGGGDCGLPTLPGDFLLAAVDDDGHVSYCSLSLEIEMMDCADVHLLDRLRKRAIDGTTSISIDPSWSNGDRGREAFFNLVEAGKNPFDMSAEDCPLDVQADDQKITGVGADPK